jgi:hypothetical protein
MRLSRLPVLAVVVFGLTAVASQAQEAAATGVAVLNFAPCAYASCRSGATLRDLLASPVEAHPQVGPLTGAPQVGYFAQAMFPAPLPCNPVTNSYALITGPRVPCPVLGGPVCAAFCAIDPTCVTATWAAYSSWVPPPSGVCFETCYCLPY